MRQVSSIRNACKLGNRFYGTEGLARQVAAKLVGSRQTGWQPESVGQLLSLQSSNSARRLPNVVPTSRAAYCSCTGAARCGKSSRPDKTNT